MPETATGLPEGFDFRETATADASTAPTGTAPATGRTFTEGEAYALVADNVQRETAAKTAENDQLKREKSELEGKLEAKDAELATERTAREAAEAKITEREAADKVASEAAERRDERVKKVREVASHLKDDFFTSERAERWSKMDDAAFDTYTKELADMAAASGAAATSTTTTSTTASGAPRETAAAGSTVKTGNEGGEKPKGLAGFASSAGYGGAAPKGA